ncbi:uncharacterized protein EAF01_002480 [Botrytis porri]|uniref:uncharacterized protein n=1 Tax=Botrytis porri TaxID=87229 RepID=UPI0019025FB1|nr:uncharacterized protein EAF01_002480 [Botrytis porri]KAF7910972.1 hypothetical protein EAF01_002480 [Botrytis porri]
MIFQRQKYYRNLLENILGNNLIPADPFGASEYFSYLALGCDAPYVFYNFGYVDEDTWEEAKTKGTMEDIPHNHSAIFAPKIQPTTTITVIPAHLRV